MQGALQNAPLAQPVGVIADQDAVAPERGGSFPLGL
jgi:hypothetical protein